MPSFNPFGGVTGRTSATLFEIRLDNDIIVLRGGDNEASSQMLKGVVVLCLPASLKCEDVHLRMTGTCKVGWNDQRLTPTGISNNRVDRTTEIFSHRWKPFVGGGGPGSSSRGTTLPAGNYEWPFELVIPGDMAESVEGLNDSHIIYKLKATVARGKLAYDLHAWKPVRIVRTLDPSALELAHAMTVENVWPNKIEYQLVIPQKAIIFGTAIEIQMRFTSLLKGLRIGQIKCILLEQQEFTIPGNASHGERTWKNSRDVETWTFELNEEEHYHDLLDDSGQDGYTLNEKMPLPKRLSRCLQDVDTNGIKVRHKVKFNVALHNPDGHVSELRATLPVTIFISPNMPLTSDGCLVDQTPMSTQSVDIASHAPPLYGEHVLDQLYADMDNSGFMTPAPQSGMNTPFYSQSRRGSHEDLSSLAGVANGGAVPPAALTSRLQNLNTGSRNSSFMRRHPSGSGDVTPAHTQAHSDRQSGYFDSHSLPHSTPLSRRTSEEDEANHSVPTSGLTSGRHSPEHDEYLALAELSKVPSYNTAVKTPLNRNASYIDPSLPNYEVASSRPASPVRSNSHPSTPGADLENGHRRNPLASMGFTPIHPPAPAHTTGHHSNHVLPQSSIEHRSRVQATLGDDDERRLHLLRNRGTAH